MVSLVSISIWSRISYAIHAVCVSYEGNLILLAFPTHTHTHMNTQIVFRLYNSINKVRWHLCRLVKGGDLVINRIISPTPRHCHRYYYFFVSSRS